MNYDNKKDFLGVMKSEVLPHHSSLITHHFSNPPRKSFYLEGFLIAGFTIGCFSDIIKAWIS
jgi:hypothetical protein